MINLIPPTAKKGIVFEYWVRVVTVWLYLWSAVMIVGICITLPTYVLISVQASVLESSAQEASEMVAGYDDVSRALMAANQQAAVIVKESRLVSVSQYLQLFESLQGAGITVTGVRLDRTADGLAPAVVTGKAIDRQTLAAFRDRLVAHALIELVDLPIANLAQDKDITFTLTVTFANPTANI
ncbi:hypothetical protein KC906_00515 [Candidatus Kaiserbacteria bacterium]|nr:hypothetical protein [Candidatus Kaiserbacteria bacterium]MCB9812435.1 hypothetical protein [Candidatus Nomurabacteria bacterium]